MTVKPNDFPDYATAAVHTTGDFVGLTNKVALDPGDVAEGNAKGVLPESRKFNWWQNLVGKWVRYFDETTRPSIVQALSSSVDGSEPSAGQFKFNNATLASVNQLRLSEDDRAGQDVRAMVEAHPQGYVRIVNRSQSTQAVFSVVAVASLGSSTDLQVVLLTSTGSFVAGTEYFIEVLPAVADSNSATIVYQPGGSANANGLYEDIGLFKTALDAMTAAGYRGTVIMDGALNGGTVQLSGDAIDLAHAFALQLVNCTRFTSTGGTELRNFTHADLGGADVDPSGGILLSHNTAAPASAEVSISGAHWVKTTGNLLRLYATARVTRIRLHDVTTMTGAQFVKSYISGNSDKFLALTVSGNSALPAGTSIASDDGEARHLAVYWSAGSPPPASSPNWDAAGASVAIHDIRGGGQSLASDGDTLALYTFADDPTADASGNSVTLAFNSTPDIAPGHYPGGKAFDAGDAANYATATAAALRLQGAMTASGVACRAARVESTCLCACGSYNSSASSNNLQFFVFVNSEGKLVVVHENGSGVKNQLASEEGAIVNGECFHWLVTRQADGQTYDGYVNGRLVLHGVAAAPPDGGGASVFGVGADGVGDYAWSGHIHETQIRGTALKPAQVRAEAAAALGIAVPDEIVGHHVQVATATAEAFAPDIVIRLADLPGGDLVNSEAITWEVDFAAYGLSVYSGEVLAGKAMLTVSRDNSGIVKMATGLAESLVTTKLLEPYGTDWPDDAALVAPIRATVTDSELRIQSEWTSGPSVSVRLRPFARGVDGDAVTWL